MFLFLNHQNLDVYQAAKKFVPECYRVASLLPVEEKFNLIQQIKRASLSVKLNIAEGASRYSEKERKRFYEISRGSLVEIDAALETAVDLEYITKEQLQHLGKVLVKVFSMLSKMI